MSRYLNTAQAAKILGISVRRIQAMIKEGKFTSARKINRSIYKWQIEEDEVNAKIKEKKNMTPNIEEGIKGKT